MKAKTRREPQKPKFIIRVHLTDGSIESFATSDENEARRIWENIEPSRLMLHPGRRNLRCHPRRCWPSLIDGQRQRNDFRLVIFQRRNDYPGLSGIRPHERFGTVPKSLLRESFRHSHCLGPFRPGVAVAVK
jgi:hypothetical protein